MPRSTVIFDTSAINCIAKDPEREALLAGLISAYFVRITETHVSEIVANSDPEKRIRLIGVLRTLLAEGECVQPFSVIIERLSKAFEADLTAFDWRRVSVRFREAEREIARQAITTDDLARIQREQLRDSEAGFEHIFSDMKPSFDTLFQNESHRPSFHDVVEIFTREGGAMWAYGDIVHAKNAPGASEERIRQFYQVCPPFRLLLLALCAAQYERCIRDIRRGPSMRAGRMDMFAATYLPYCDIFISNDKRQLHSFRTVADEGQTAVTICSYEEFRNSLTGFL